MRKNVFGRQLKRDVNERKALFKTLLSSLVMYESIQTSEAKAKAIKSSADKLITKAKKGGLHAYRLVEPDLSTAAVKKLLTTIAPRFSSRQGGYTRIIRVGKRLKDQSQEVILEWTERENVAPVKAEKKVEDKKVAELEAKVPVKKTAAKKTETKKPVTKRAKAKK